MSGRSVRDPRDARPDGRYGPTFWQVIGLLAVHTYASKAELARELGRVNRRPVARQQVYAIIKEAVKAGFIDRNPFPELPKMRRAKC